MRDGQLYATARRNLASLVTKTALAVRIIWYNNIWVGVLVQLCCSSCIHDIRVGFDRFNECIYTTKHAAANSRESVRRAGKFEGGGEGDWLASKATIIICIVIIYYSYYILLYNYIINNNACII